ncbi:MAG TPA: glycosyltransferase family A protein, partial [Nitrososphaeraceae archaeon]|nr:glycosyltransferase family A protein [Nitrososphaeraceae archaeon]
MATLEEELIDVVIRTKNSEEFLKECLRSIHEEIPVRRIIIVDAGSTDKTLEIASSFDKACVYVKPDLNLGQATKFGFSKAETEWVAIIDSDVILGRGWFDQMKRYMNEWDAVEGCRIDHYRFHTQIDCTKSIHGRFGQTLLKREPVLNMDLDLPFG